MRYMRWVGLVAVVMVGLAVIAFAPVGIAATNYICPAVADLNGDGSLDVVYGVGSTLYAVNRASNTMLWSIDLGATIGEASPKIADINGDGKPEVLIGAMNGVLYCLSNKGKVLWRFQSKCTKRVTTPAIADINGDGIPDIVFSGYHWSGGPDDGTYVYALTTNGNAVHELWSTVVSLPGVPWGKSAPTIGDINNDGKLEIIAACKNRTVALSSEGKEIWATSEPAEGGTYMSAAIGDLTGNGTLDSVLASKGGVVHALDSQGKDLTWFDVKGKVDRCSPAIADINKDGVPDIIVSSDTGTYVISMPSSFPAEGSIIWKSEIGERNAQIALGDLNGDGVLDVVVDGHVLDGKTGKSILTYSGGKFPVIADFDGDGFLEIGAVSGSAFVLTKTRAKCKPNEVVWGQYQHDLRNTGNFAATEEGKLK